MCCHAETLDSVNKNPSLSVHIAELSASNKVAILDMLYVSFGSLASLS